MNSIVKDFLFNLNKDNLLETTLSFVEKIIKKNTNVDSNENEIMFILHNKNFPNKVESGKTCPPCRERVWNKLLKLYNDKNNIIK
jgi:hypothetical protein